MASHAPPSGRYTHTMHQCDQVNTIAFTIHPTREIRTPIKVLSLPEVSQQLSLALNHLEQAKSLNFPDMTPSMFILVTAYHDLLISLLNYFRKYFPMLPLQQQQRRQLQ